MRTAGASGNARVLAPPAVSWTKRASAYKCGERVTTTVDKIQTGRVAVNNNRKDKQHSTAGRASANESTVTPLPIESPAWPLAI
eukprot:6173222-Pleurochrysis_carterae.AAC.4